MSTDQQTEALESPMVGDSPTSSASPHGGATHHHAQIGGQVAQNGQGTLGQFLRAEREQRGIMLEQVATATRIGLKTLEALEGDQYHLLPAKPFVRGFVSAYVKFLGLESRAVLTRFSGFLDESIKQRPVLDQGFSGYAFERPEGEQSKRVLWAIMGSFMVVGLVAVAIIKPAMKRREQEKLAAIQNSETKVTPPVVTPAEVRAPASQTPSPSPNQPSAPVQGATGAISNPVAASVAAPEKPEVVAPQVAATPSVATPPASAKAERPAESSAVPAANTATTQDAATADNDDELKLDPLQSGVRLKSEAIKYKMILKALGDVEVRYTTDTRQKMRFWLRKGKVLVLRAEKGIKLEVSNPKAIVMTNTFPTRAKVAAGGRQLALGTAEPDLSKGLFAGDAPMAETPFEP